MIGTRAASPSIMRGAPTPGIPAGMNDFDPVMAIDTTPIAALPNLSGPRRDPATGRANWTETGISGVGQRFGDWLHQPGTAAMLLRSGAATLKGGLADGLAAGAGYADQQEQQEAAAGQRAFENQMATLRQAVSQQQADQTGAYQQGSLTNDAFRIDEQGRSNRAREGIDANGQRIQLYGIKTGAETQRRGQDVSLVTSREGNAQQDRSSQRSYDASIYGTDAETYRAGRAAGIGSKGYSETQTKIPGSPAVGRWFGPDTPAVPESVTTTRTDLAPGGNEIRYDAAGNAYRRDPATGQPVRVR